MKKIIITLKELLLYGGLHRKEYKTIEAEIDEANRKSLVILSSGEGSVHERTTLYLVFVVVAPMLYALSALELAAVVIPAEIFYLILIREFQSSYSVYATNKGNSLFFSITGLLLGIYMANMKISGIYNTYKSARMDEIRQLNEELSVSREKLQTAFEEAEKANRAKTTFLNNMSHDIRRYPDSHECDHWFHFTC